jgi:hypothetical protein
MPFTRISSANDRHHPGGRLRPLFALQACSPGAVLVKKKTSGRGAAAQAACGNRVPGIAGIAAASRTEYWVVVVP